MFLDILEFTEENKKKLFRENGFENGLIFVKRIVIGSTKLHSEKVQILRKIKTKNQESVNNLWRILGTKPDLLVDF